MEKVKEWVEDANKHTKDQYLFMNETTIEIKMCCKDYGIRFEEEGLELENATVSERSYVLENVAKVRVLNIELKMTPGIVDSLCKLCGKLKTLYLKGTVGENVSMDALCDAISTSELHTLHFDYPDNTFISNLPKMLRSGSIECLVLGNLDLGTKQLLEAFRCKNKLHSLRFQRCTWSDTFRLCPGTICNLKDLILDEVKITPAQLNTLYCDLQTYSSKIERIGVDTRAIHPLQAGGTVDVNDSLLSLVKSSPRINYVGASHAGDELKERISRIVDLPSLHHYGIIVTLLYRPKGLPAEMIKMLADCFEFRNRPNEEEEQ